MKYYGSISDQKDIVNKGYVDTEISKIEYPSVLVGESEPATSLGKNGDIYIQTSRNTSFTQLTGGVMTEDINMASHKVTGLPTPTDATDAVPFGDASWELYSVDTLAEDVNVFTKSWTDTDIKQVFVSLDGKTGGNTTSNKDVNMFFEQDVGYRVLLCTLSMRSNSDVHFSGRMFCLPGRGVGASGGLGHSSYYQNCMCAAGYENRDQGGQYIHGVKLQYNLAYSHDTTITLAAGTQIKIWRKRV